jgi:hypothetical protein
MLLGAQRGQCRAIGVGRGFEAGLPLSVGMRPVLPQNLVQASCGLGRISVVQATDSLESDHVSALGRLEQLAVCAWCLRADVDLNHLSHESRDLGIDSGPATSAAALPFQKQLEPLAMPGDDGRRFDG